MVLMSKEVFIFTMNQGIGRGKWSRYRFPFTIEQFAQLKGNLYLRHGDKVSKVVENEQYDDGVIFSSTIQWPWLDFKSPGRNKMMMGFDNVGEGAASIEIGYDQSSLTAFTTAFAIPEDTVPGHIIPLPVTGPSFSIKLTYVSDQAWQWDALQIYVDDTAIGT